MSISYFLRATTMVVVSTIIIFSSNLNVYAQVNPTLKPWIKTHKPITAANHYKFYTDLIAVPDDGYILSGQGTFIGAIGKDAFITKLKPGGEIQWAKKYGTSEQDEFIGIDENPLGGYFAGGSKTSGPTGTPWVAVIDNDGALQVSKTYHDSSYYQRIVHTQTKTRDGNFILGGMVYPDFEHADEEQKLFVMEVDGRGDILWQHEYAQPDEGFFHSQYANLVIEEKKDDSGYLLLVEWEVYVSEVSALRSDMIILGIDQTGNLLWSNKYDKNGQDIRAEDIALLNDGSFAVTGFSSNFDWSFYEGFLMRVNANGTPLWTKDLEAFDGASEKPIFFHSVNTIGPTDIVLSAGLAPDFLWTGVLNGFTGVISKQETVNKKFLDSKVTIHPDETKMIVRGWDTHPAIGIVDRVNLYEKPIIGGGAQMCFPSDITVTRSNSNMNSKRIKFTQLPLQLVETDTINSISVISIDVDVEEQCY